MAVADDTVTTDALTTAMQSNASTAFAGTGSAFTNLTATFNTAGLSISAPATSSISATGAVSISTNGNTISIGAPAFSAGVTTLGNTSGNTGTVSNQLVFAGGNNITLSGSTAAGGMTLTISGPNVGGAQTGISGLVVSNTTYTSGTVSFRDGNGITFASGTGQGVSLTHGLQFTSNTSAITASALNTSQSSLFQQTSATSAITSAAFPSAQTTKFAGTGTTFSGTNVSGSITLNSNGLNLALSAPAAAGAQTAISGMVVSNTTYTSGTVSFRDGNGITFASGTGQGVSLTHGLQFTSATSAITSNALNTSQSSVFFQTSQSSVFLQTSQSSLFQQTSATSAITSAAFPSAQTTKFAGTGTTFSGTNVSGSITLNSNGLNLALSAPAAAGAQTAISGLVVSNTTYTSGTVSFRDGNGITFASGTGQGLSITHGLQFTSATSAITSNALNTSQSSLFFQTSASSVFLQTSQSSLFQHTSATSAITSAAFPSAQTTKFAGTGTTFSGTNVSGSITLNSNGLNLALSAAAGGGGGGGVVFANSQTTYTQVLFHVCAKAAVLSPSRPTRAQRIDISVPATSSIIAGSGVALSSTSNSIYIYNDYHDIFVANAQGASQTSSIGANVLVFAPMYPVDNYSFTCFEQMLTIPAAQVSSNSYQAALTMSYGLYKMETASSSRMSLVQSSSMFMQASARSTANTVAYTVNFNNSATSYSSSSNNSNVLQQIGARYVQFRFPFAGTLQAGEVYYLGMAYSHTFTSNSNILRPPSSFGALPHNVANMGYVGPDTASPTATGALDFMGFAYSNTTFTSGGWPSTIATSQTAMLPSGFMPYLVFKNIT